MRLSNKTKILIQNLNLLPLNTQVLESSLKSEHINRTEKYIDSIILNKFPALRNDSNYEKKLHDFSESIFDLFFSYSNRHYRLKSIRSFFTLCKSTGRKLDLNKINLIEKELRAIYSVSRTKKNRINLDVFVEHKKTYLDDVIERKKRIDLGLKIINTHDLLTSTPDLKFLTLHDINLITEEIKKIYKINKKDLLIYAEIIQLAYRDISHNTTAPIVNFSDSEIKSIEKEALSEFNTRIKDAMNRNIGRPILESSKLIDDICFYFHKIFGFELKEHIQDKNVYEEIRYSGNGLDFIYQLLKLNLFINNRTLIELENNCSVFDIIFRYDLELHNQDFISDSREVVFDTKIRKYIGEYVYTHSNYTYLN